VLEAYVVSQAIILYPLDFYPEPPRVRDFFLSVAVENLLESQGRRTLRFSGGDLLFAGY
jgi:hypothetical protein